MMYYFIIICLCFGIGMFFVALKENKLKTYFISTAIAIAVAIIGILPSITSVLTTNEYAKETMRGGTSELSGHDKKTNGGLDKDYAFSWSLGMGESFCVMIPYLYGGATQEPKEWAPKVASMVDDRVDMLPIYWGPQPTQMGPVYFGAVICFFFLLGLFIIRSPHKWWILAASIIGFVLAWGKNFEGVNYFLFDHIPYLNKFRTVEMAMVIPQFLFPLLGFWALQDVLDRKLSNEQLWKGVKLSAGITAGLCILLGVGGSLFFSFAGSVDAQLSPEMVKAIKDDRAALAMSSGLKSAIFILLAATLLWAYIKEKINPTILFAGIALLVVIDLVPVSHNYLSEKYYTEASDLDATFDPRPVDKQILQDKDPYYRVLDITRDPYNDAIQAYFHKCVGGYHPAKMEIYQDLIKTHLSQKGFNSQVLNMLNTKYIIVGGQKSAPQVMPNPGACGNAWFVNEIKWAATADDEMNGLNAARLGDTVMVPNAFDAKKTVVIRNTFKNDIGNYTFGKDSTASIKLSKYGLDDLAFTSNNSKDGLAVFSDIYYAGGWKAYVDGKETPIIRANYVLRAIKIPAGNHAITFEFRPQSFYNGRKLALVGSILLLLLCGTALFRGLKSPKSA